MKWVFGNVDLKDDASYNFGFFIENETTDEEIEEMVEEMVGLYDICESEKVHENIINVEYAEREDEGY